MPKILTTYAAIDQVTLALIKDERLDPEDRLVLVDHCIKLLHIYNDSVRGTLRDETLLDPVKAGMSFDSKQKPADGSV